MNIAFKFLMMLTVSFFAFARPPLEVTQDVVVTEQGVDAKQEAFRKAVEDASTKLISETIGSDALEKQSDRIKQVLNRSEKYILFIKGSNPEAVPEGSRVRVEMKISLDNFEALLREYGLVQSTNRTARLIPIVSWSSDNGTIRSSWWTDAPSGTASKVWAKFSSALVTRLKSRNIRLAEGLNFDRVPPALRKRQLAREELVALAKLFDATLIVYGDVHFVRESSGEKAQVQTELIDVRSQKALESVQTTLGGANASPENLAIRVADNVNEQIRSAQASGLMNLSSFRLIVRGDLNFQKLDLFKKELLEQVLDIRAMKDRLYAPAEFVFEAESNRQISELAAEIRKARFTHMKVTAQGDGASDLVLSITTL
jgi:hypothetical protein